MSESTDFIKDYEKLVRQKPVLTAQVVELRRQVEETGKALEELTNKKQGIIDDIKAEENESIARIEEREQSMNRVINQENERLSAQSEKQNETATQQEATKTLQAQLKNELDAKEEALTSRECVVDHKQLTNKHDRSELVKLQDEVDAKTAKCVSLAQDIENQQKVLYHRKYLQN